MTDSEVVSNDAETSPAPCTIVPIPLEVRAAKAVLPLLVAVPLATIRLLETLDKGTLVTEWPGPVLILAIGGGIAYKLYSKQEKLVLAATVTPIPLKNRLRKSGLILVSTLLASILIWAVQYSSNQLRQYWTYVWPLWPAALFFAYMFFRESESRVLTPSAEQYLQLQKQAKQAQINAENSKFDALMQHWWARYPLAVFLVWMAISAASKPEVKLGTWLFVIGAVVLAGVLAKELSRMLLGVGALVLGIGAIYLVFQGAAALPVGAAVIIGAIIIASAVRR
ncbi:MAG: hypothetical protein NDI88_07535 [Lysobacter sp.]|nr:hypothetical protein [Lysobacter sp.]